MLNLINLDRIQTNQASFRQKVHITVRNDIARMIQKITISLSAKLLSRTIMGLKKSKREFLKMDSKTVIIRKIKAFLFLQNSKMEDMMIKKHLTNLIPSLFSQASLIFITLYLELHKTNKFNIPHQYTVNQDPVILILKILNIWFASRKYMMVRKLKRLKKE